MKNISGKMFETIILNEMRKKVPLFQEASKKHDHYDGTDCYIDGCPFDITLNPNKDHLIEVGYIWNGLEKPFCYRNKDTPIVKVSFRTRNKHHEFMMPVIVLDFSENPSVEVAKKIINERLLLKIKNLLLDIKYADTFSFDGTNTDSFISKELDDLIVLLHTYESYFGKFIGLYNLQCYDFYYDEYFLR